MAALSKGTPRITCTASPSTYSAASPALGRCHSEGQEFDYVSLWLLWPPPRVWASHADQHPWTVAQAGTPLQPLNRAVAHLSGAARTQEDRVLRFLREPTECARLILEGPHPDRQPGRQAKSLPFSLSPGSAVALPFSVGQSPSHFLSGLM